MKEKKGKITFQKIKSFFQEEVTQLKTKDWLLMGVFVLFYSVLSFYNLGSLKNPQTYYEFHNQGEEVGLMLTGEATTVGRIRHFTGPETGTYQLYGSMDGSTYEPLNVILEQKSVFLWDDLEVQQKFKYLKIVSNQAGSFLGEMQLYDIYGEKLEVEPLDDQSAVVVDELDTVPVNNSYLNSTYFDEIYFARTAYEYVHGMPTTEWTHPPLGKLLQMIPILFLGMSTFAYRLMGNIAGILMIPVIYIFAKDLFKKRKYAFLAMILMTFSCFHFAQTRMGTVDSFLVLFIMLSAMFMYKYLILPKNAPLKKKYLNLGFSGLFVGCAIATKWTGFYAGLALAIVFFVHFFVTRKRKDQKGFEFGKEALRIILFCVLAFVVVPLVIYLLCYFCFPNLYPYPIHSLGDLWNETMEMYHYHADLVATHPFSSPWYSWPIMHKPVWYYVGYYTGDLKSTITGIGNPAIWWVGIVGMLYLLIDTIKNKKKESAYLLTFILCLWLPYALIGRIMFMYHFFPVLPFVMLANVALIRWITEKFKDHTVYFFYTGVVILFFCYFYPVISGALRSQSFIDTLRWFSSWIF